MVVFLAVRPSTSAEAPSAPLVNCPDSKGSQSGMDKALHLKCNLLWVGPVGVHLAGHRQAKGALPMGGCSEPVAPAPVPADLQSSASVQQLPSASQEGPKAEAIVPPFSTKQAASGQALAAADLAAFEAFCSSPGGLTSLRWCSKGCTIAAGC